MDEDQRDVRDDEPGPEPAFKNLASDASSSWRQARWSLPRSLRPARTWRLGNGRSCRATASSAYRLVDDAAELTAIAPLRSREVREGDSPQKAVR
jgi:hypothetical protein